MKAKWLPIALILLCSVLFIPGADASGSHLGGEGHDVGIDVTYSSADHNIATIQLSSKPYADVAISVVSIDDYQVIEPVEASKVIKVFLRPLAEGTHTFLLTISSTGAPIAQCDVVVGYMNTVIYDSNGGSGYMMNSEVKSGSEFNLPGCSFSSPSGMKFSHWEIDGKQYSPGSTVMVTSDITAKAVWTEDNTSSIVLIIGVLVVILIILLLAVLLLRRRH